MKKLAITVAAVFATLNIFAQGTVNFSNIGLNAPVLDSTVIGSTGLPSKAVAGTTFSVALYWSPATGTTAPDPSTFGQVGPTGHLAAAGTYTVGTVDITAITPPGSMGWFQVKAWSTALGMTYEAAYAQAVAGGLGLFGVSSEIDIPTGNPTTVPAGTPHNLTGISSILLAPVVVPEPSVIGLGLLGGAALLLWRRRK